MTLHQCQPTTSADACRHRRSRTGCGSRSRRRSRSLTRSSRSRRCSHSSRRLSHAVRVALQSESAQTSRGSAARHPRAAAGTAGLHISRQQLCQRQAQRLGRHGRRLQLVRAQVAKRWRQERRPLQQAPVLGRQQRLLGQSTWLLLSSRCVRLSSVRQTLQETCCRQSARPALLPAMAPWCLFAAC
jgi:hypothetical protein